MQIHRCQPEGDRSLPYRNASHQLREASHCVRFLPGGNPIAMGLCALFIRKSAHLKPGIAAIAIAQPHRLRPVGERMPLLAAATRAVTSVRNLSLASTCQPRLEPEVVFGMSAAPKADTSVDDLFDAIDWVAPGFEVVQ